MAYRQPRLPTEIALIVVIKLALVGLIWWAFFAGQASPVDQDKAASHVLAEARKPVSNQGEKHAQ